MFAEGNTDRFGDQVYPVNYQVKRPGPGTYQYDDSMESKVRKILVV